MPDTRNTILIAENDLVQARHLKMILEGRGYSVPAIATTGQEALHLAAEAQPDLILMDIRLSGQMDGFQTAALLQSHFDLPIVYASALADEPGSRQIASAESYGFVGKPYEERVVAVTVEMALRNHALKKQLQASEARYRAVSELMSDWAYSFRVEPDGQLAVEWLTDSATRMTGYTAQDLAQGWASFVHPDDRAGAPERMQRILSGQLSQGEWRLVTKSGETLWLHSSARPEWDAAPGRVTRIVGAARDITERKRAESQREAALEALRESEWRFRSLINNISDVVTVIHRDGAVVFESPSVERILGYRPEELMGKRIIEFVHPDDVPTVQLAAQRLFRDPACTLTVEARFRHRDGHWLDMSATAQTMVDASGEMMLVITSRDTTERKQAEEALQEIARGLAEAQKMAHIGSWSWDVSTDTVKWSGELYRINGRDPRSPAPSLAEQQSLYTPASWELLRAAVEQTLSTQKPYALELQVFRADGALIWLEAHGEAIQDEQGRTVGLRGTAQDITERKRVEEELRASEARERDRARELATLLDAAPAIVWIAHDPDCVSITGNRAASEFLRMPPDANLSKTAPRTSVRVTLRFGKTARKSLRNNCRFSWPRAG